MVERRTYLEHLVHVAKLRAVGLVREVDIVARHLADAFMMHRAVLPLLAACAPQHQAARTGAHEGDQRWSPVCDQGIGSQGTGQKQNSCTFWLLTYWGVHVPLYTS